MDYFIERLLRTREVGGGCELCKCDNENFFRTNEMIQECIFLKLIIYRLSLSDKSIFTKQCSIQSPY